jgi:hypothetical protein
VKHRRTSIADTSHRTAVTSRSFFLLGPLGTGKTTCSEACWRTPSGSEVDFIWTRAERAIGIEVKAAAHWRREFGGPLKSLIEDRIVQSGFGVYTGTAELKDGPLRVLPLRSFLKELTAGNVLH